jgi:hypothetical protein
MVLVRARDFSDGSLFTVEARVRTAGVAVAYLTLAISSTGLRNAGLLFLCLSRQRKR